MILSVIVPTRNEAANIGACLGAFAAVRDRVELVVVDNFSADGTADLAAALGACVFQQGPERSAQRNRGWRASRGEFVMFVDADMIVPPATVSLLLKTLESSPGVDGWYVPEIRVGRGLRVRARNFERSFYDGTEIDGLRVIRRAFLERAGGYDENLVACEDWDLDRRVLALGAKTAVLALPLHHNEARQDLKRFLAKKAYYSQSVGRYRAKWGNDAICRRQFGFFSRYFRVFLTQGRWKRLLAHPILATVMYVERVLVGITYLLHR